jgi:hypothetical protein
MQLAPEASALPQLLVSVKSATVKAMLSMLSVTLEGFINVTDRGALGVPTG